MTALYNQDQIKSKKMEEATQPAIAAASAGVALGAAVGIAALVAEPGTVSWSRSLPLLGLVAVFFPLWQADLAFQSAFDAIQSVVDYPGAVINSMKAYKSNQTICNVTANKIASEAFDYTFPNDVDDARDAIDEYRPYVYVIAGAIFGTGAVVAAAACTRNRIFATVVNIPMGHVISTAFALFLAMGLALETICDEYVNKDELDATVRWFVDPSANNTEANRPWLTDLGLDAFLDECEQEAPALVLRALRPGALEGAYDDFKDAACSDVPEAFYGTSAVVGASYFLWLAFVAHAVVVRFLNKKESEEIEILLQNLIY